MVIQPLLSSLVMNLPDKVWLLNLSNYPSRSCLLYGGVDQIQLCRVQVQKVENPRRIKKGNYKSQKFKVTEREMLTGPSKE